jgi:hypothetical protein
MKAPDQLDPSHWATKSIELLKYAPWNRSCPRVVTGKWLLKILKLAIISRNEAETNHKIKPLKQHKLGLTISQTLLFLSYYFVVGPGFTFEFSG